MALTISHVSSQASSSGHICFRSLPPNATMGEAISTVFKKNRTAVAVIDKGALKGIVTRTDLLKTLDGVSTDTPHKLRLTAIMSDKLVVAEPMQSFRHAMERMTRFNVEHLPIIDDDRFLTVLHQSDLLRLQVNLLHAEIAHLHEYINGLHNAEQD